MTLIVLDVIMVAEITENEQALGQASSSSSSYSSSSSSSRSRSIRASVIIVTDSIPADGEVLTGTVRDPLPPPLPPPLFSRSRL